MSFRTFGQWVEAHEKIQKGKLLPRNVSTRPGYEIQGQEFQFPGVYQAKALAGDYLSAIGSVINKLRGEEGQATLAGGVFDTSSMNAERNSKDGNYFELFWKYTIPPTEWATPEQLQQIQSGQRIYSFNRARITAVIQKYKQEARIRLDETARKKYLEAGLSQEQINGHFKEAEQIRFQEMPIGKDYGYPIVFSRVYPNPGRIDNSFNLDGSRDWGELSWNVENQNQK